MRLIICFIAIALLVPNVSISGVIFEDNFDGHADWSPTQGTSAIECQFGEGCPVSPPNGYVGYRIGAKGSCAEDGKNTLNIDASEQRGGSGKSLFYWNEPCLSPSSSWGSDGLLVIDLPTGYSELYVRYYQKFQSTWEWNVGTSSAQKFLRASHYWDGSIYDYGEGGNQHPVWYSDLSKGNSGIADISYFSSYRYENTFYPAEATPSHSSADTFYFGDGGYGGGGTDFTDSGMMGDGNWHCFEYYIKMNSAPGVADGLHMMWFDGNLIANVTDLAWADQGASGVLWNQVTIGGNNSNYYSSGGEQWYALDDVVISTSYIGPESVPVGGYSEANVIPAGQVSQATDGSGTITINFKALDEFAGTITLSTFEYSTDDGSTWVAPTNADSSEALISTWADNSYSSGEYADIGSGGTAAEWSAATAYSFTLNTKHADVTTLNQYEGDVKFRFYVNNGNPTSSNDPVQTESFSLDNMPPAKIEPRPSIN